MSSFDGNCSKLSISFEYVGLKYGLYVKHLPLQGDRLFICYDFTERSVLKVFPEFRTKYVSEILFAGRSKIRTCKIEGNSESLQFP